ncbi:hypothetical protein MAR_020738 [Mya arenaria]|uniref:Uncharacterized protein n=1 Tax=Mya arenaria TaxID=6604 RepID=A0ABY7E838_MYAAR|nr:hypothetical protein MAR_020738 [Mya arenaria]
MTIFGSRLFACKNRVSAKRPLIYISYYIVSIERKTCVRLRNRKFANLKVILEKCYCVKHKIQKNQDFNNVLCKLLVFS